MVSSFGIFNLILIQKILLRILNFKSYKNKIIRIVYVYNSIITLYTKHYHSFKFDANEIRI